MSIGSFFNAGSSIDPGLFEDVLKNTDYSQVFGDTSTAFGGNTVDLFGGGGGWNFVEPSNSNTPDFSNIFNSPAPGGLGFSAGFNSPANLFEPSKGLTFDPGSVNKLESILDDVARGGMPTGLVPSSRSRFPTGLVPSANPNPVRSRPAAGGSMSQPSRPKPGTIQGYEEDLKKDQWQRYLDMIRYAEGTNKGKYAKTHDEQYRVMFGGRILPADKAGPNHPGGGAYGAYQFKPMTVEDLRKRGPAGIASNLANPRVQDMMALELTRRRDPALYDKISSSQDVTFEQMIPIIRRASKEWASLPNDADVSSYGQPVKRTADLRLRWNSYQPTTYGSISR